MKKWRVYNKHPLGYTHKEMFKGDMVEIKANEYVLMDYEDAVQFRGQYFPMLMTADDQPDPKGFKVIKIEPDDEAKEEVVELPVSQQFICQFDGKKFETQTQLDNYIQKNHSDKIFKDEMLEKELEKDKKIKGK